MACNRLAGRASFEPGSASEGRPNLTLRHGGNNMSGVHSGEYAIIQAIMGLPQRAGQYITLQAADAGRTTIAWFVQ